MVFLTVGTVDSSFSRLVRYVDQLIEDGYLDEVFGQIGTSTYSPENFRYAQFLQRSELHRLVVEAEFVIAHAGTGSANMCVESGKRLIVVPRRAEFGEHPDDHQLELAHYLEDKGLARSAESYEELAACVTEMSGWRPAIPLSKTDELPAVKIVQHALTDWTRSNMTSNAKGIDSWRGEVRGESASTLGFKHVALQIYYTIKPLIPRWLQIAIRRIIAQRRRRDVESVWPILHGSESPPVGWHGWPGGHRFALVLTHDVEHTGQDRRCRQIAEREQTIGFRSAFNFVPMQSSLTPDLRSYLVKNGFEIGVHGLMHDGKLFRSKEVFDSRAPLINQHLDRWNAVGFRAPAMHHNLEWLKALKVKYDSSTFDTDPFEPQADGTATIFPFIVERGQNRAPYVELPYTLAQDHTLFVLLGEEDDSVWREKLDWLANHGGMALLNTHPDYMWFGEGTRRVDEYGAELYFDFLKHVLEKYRGAYWNPLPRELAAYIRKWSVDSSLEESRQPTERS